MKIFDVEDKVAVVTGASSGLGARFARVLSEAGAKVTLAARRLDRIEDLAADLGRAIAVETDITSEEACEALIDRTVAEWGRVDILVNAAGVSAPVPALEESTTAFAGIVGVNLVGAFSMMRAAGAAMIERGSGCIVNVASVVGLVGLGRMPQASYAASKGGVVNLTRELAAQWARSGIRVNAIAPGFFPTEMTAELFSTDAGEEWVAKLTPMGRSGRLEELDGPLLFLCSNASSYMTGSVVVVDGGWTAV